VIDRSLSGPREYRRRTRRLDAGIFIFTITTDLAGDREDTTMAEWPSQIAEFQRTWVEQQQKMMSEWMDSLKNASNDASPASWRKAADVMEKQVNSALDSQKQSLMAIAGNVENIEGVPDAFTQTINQLEKGIELWADVQRRLWKVWFDMLRATSPVPQTPGEAMMENWQEMVRKTMSIQEQWLSNWSAPESKSTGASRKKAST
jgi:hypothetical protein